MNRIQRVVRDPLFHFVAIGGLIFVLYSLTAEPEPEQNERVIHVTAGTIDWLTTTWQARWKRPPTEAELEGLIHNYVRESVLYREALAMGLDEDDTIVRRRLAQKLEFLTQDLAGLTTPTAEQLRAYLDAHRSRYERPARRTIAHVFFSPDKRKDAAADARVALAKLLESGAGTDSTQGTGDRFMLQSYYPQKSRDELGRLFGHEFGEAVFALPLERWQGPVASGYGVHLVYVRDRTEPSMPPWDEVKERVQEDWVAEKREEFVEQYYERLRERYEVVIDR